MKNQIEEVCTDYVCNQNLRHIDVYFVGLEEGKTIAVIDLDTRKVIYFENEIRYDEKVKAVVTEVLATTALPSEITIPEVVCCPHCGSDDIYADAFEPEGCYVPVGCNSCDHEWIDTYKYTGIQEVSQITSF